MNRREFIKKSLLASTLSVNQINVWATPSSPQASPAKLLIVMLRGAYDGNSLLVPHGFPYYYTARPTIAIAAPDPANPAAAIDLSQGYGLHPVVAASLLPLYRQHQLAFVPFSGSQDLSRSHFQAQDVIELGRNASSLPDYSSGFLDRLVGVLKGKSADVGGIAFTNNLPLSFKGPTQIPNISLNGDVHDIPDDHQMQLLQAMYNHTPLNPYLQSGIDTRHDVVQTLSHDAAMINKDMLASGRGASKPGAFASITRKISALMRDNPGYSIGFVDIGGWDSHVNQGNANGILSNNLDNLSQGLAEFADEMGATMWQHTVVVVVSEFGRTFHENGTHGTDHGHGNTLWVLGGGINGGRLAGDMTDLTPNSLFQQRDTPLLNDYRSVLADLMRGMYGLTSGQLGLIFPGAPINRYHLV